MPAEIKRLQTNEPDKFIRLIGLFNDIFDVAPPSVPADEHLAGLLHNPAFIAYAIISDGSVIGGLTAYLLPMYQTGASEAFIYDVGIDSSYQRQGWGRKLMASFLEYCREQGITTAFVLAGEEDIHAVDFYRSTGAPAEKVVLFSYQG